MQAVLQGRAYYFTIFLNHLIMFVHIYIQLQMDLQGMLFYQENDKCSNNENLQKITGSKLSENVNCDLATKFKAKPHDKRHFV